MPKQQRYTSEFRAEAISWFDRGLSQGDGNKATHNPQRNAGKLDGSS